MGMSAATSQAGVTFKAAYTSADREVTVVRNVHAGISGPFGDYPDSWHSVFMTLRL